MNGTETTGAAAAASGTRTSGPEPNAATKERGDEQAATTATAAEPQAAPREGPATVTGQGGDISALLGVEHPWQLLPPEMVRCLAHVQPPRPAEEEFAMSMKLIQALHEARRHIQPMPKTANVNFKSRRTQEEVDYSFTPLDTLHREAYAHLWEQGLVTTCVIDSENAYMAMILVHREGGLLGCGMPRPAHDDIKDTGTQITLQRQYLTTALLDVCSEQDTDVRDIAPAGGQRARDRGGRQAGNGRTAANARPRDARSAERAPQNGRPAASAATTRAEAGTTAPAAPAGQAAGNAGAATPRERGTQEPRAQGAPGPEAQAAGTTDERAAEVEPRIADGMRKSEMTASEQMALRAEYMGRPDELLKHMKAIYRARRDHAARSAGQPGDRA